MGQEWRMASAVAFSCETIEESSANLPTHLSVDH
jgi:hypothetical protein